MNRTLNELCPGESAVVGGLAPGSGAEIARRLLDIGLTGGANVKCLFSAPSGEPRAYLIRGAVIALRREDARLIRTAEAEVSA